MDGVVAEVLDRFGIAPNPDLNGLRAVMSAWLREVPFDNVLKRIQLKAGGLTPLDADAFLRSWLHHRTGGTCWPNATALAHVLSEVGFEVRTACGPIARPGPSGEPPAQDVTPGHATVLVALDGDSWLADGGLGCNAPLLLDPDSPTSHDDLSWTPVDGEAGVLAWATGGPNGGWRFRPVRDPTPPTEMEQRWQRSSEASIFNATLHASRRLDDRYVTVAGSTLRLHTFADDRYTSEVLTDEARRAVLLEVLGYSEEIIDQLPPDDR